MRFFKIIISILAVTLVSCKSIQQVQKGQSAKSNLTEQQQLDFTYGFFEAKKYQLQGNLELAINLFQGCLKIDSSSSACYYNLAKIYLQKKDMQVAENYAQKAIDYHPENETYLYLAGLLYQNNNKMKESEQIFEQLIKKDDRNLSYYLNLADAYLKDKNFKEAMKVYDRVEKTFGISEMIVLQKSKVYIAQNKVAEARAEIERLSKSNPQSLEYRRMLADFDIQVQNYPQAIKTYNDILKEHPNDGFSHIGLAQCYTQQNKVDKVFKHLQLALKSEDVPSEVKKELFFGIWQTAKNMPKDMQPKLFELTKILIKEHPNDPDINTIYADFLLRTNKLKEAREVLRKIVKHQKDKYIIWEQLILLENEFQDWQACYDETNEAINYFPNQSLLYFFKGYSAYNLKKRKESLEAFEFGYKLVPKTDPMYKDYLSFLAEGYHEKGDNKRSFKFYDELLEIDPNNVYALNNYAYFLSEEKNPDLDKAKTMSYKTVFKEPENSTFLDTYAWILFKKKEYAEALKYIEKAVKYNNDKSAVIVEHYADILYHNNKKDKALEFWKKAKTIGKASKFLDEKINKKTYVE